MQSSSSSRRADDLSVEPVPLRLRKLRDDAVLPRRMSAGAAGLDLVAVEPTTLAPGDIAVVPCGFAMSLPTGYEAQVRPRSGLASRHGITLVNTPGTIDSDYRGEVKVPLINLGKSAFSIEAGDRIAQMVITRVPPVELIEVDELDDTDRGTGGFGHTG